MGATFFFNWRQRHRAKLCQGDRLVVAMIGSHGGGRGVGRSVVCDGGRCWVVVALVVLMLGIMVVILMMVKVVVVVVVLV